MPSASTHRIRYRKSDKTYIPQQPWQLANKCAVCNGHFSPFRLRHHCRNCGISVCGSHSRRRVRIPSSLLSDRQRSIGNMSPVGDMSLWRAQMARRANQVKQMQKIRETSHSTAPYRLQSEASIPSGPRPASISC
ncbi:unnamed protein product [Albugo candida]|uniref:FYVE zinc finger domain-containing protein n=1 Tax=Albugo candida TaxID=65357 RepID=A0A024FTD9_9STRA|nr:unnamed protein product [Albugo candida]|eukprot:CCI10281.1 unnamed protein product [Albugo candida]